MNDESIIAIPWDPKLIVLFQISVFSAGIALLPGESAVIEGEISSPEEEDKGYYKKYRVRIIAHSKSEGEFIIVPKGNDQELKPKNETILLPGQTHETIIEIKDKGRD